MADDRVLSSRFTVASSTKSSNEHDMDGEDEEDDIGREYKEDDMGGEEDEEYKDSGAEGGGKKKKTKSRVKKRKVTKEDDEEDVIERLELYRGYSTYSKEDNDNPSIADIRARLHINSFRRNKQSTHSALKMAKVKSDTTLLDQSELQMFLVDNISSLTAYGLAVLNEERVVEAIRLSTNRIGFAKNLPQVIVDYISEKAVYAAWELKLRERAMERILDKAVSKELCSDLLFLHVRTQRLPSEESKAECILTEKQQAKSWIARVNAIGTLCQVLNVCRAQYASRPTWIIIYKGPDGIERLQLEMESRAPHLHYYGGLKLLSSEEMVKANRFYVATNPNPDILHFEAPSPWLVVNGRGKGTQVMVGLGCQNSKAHVHVGEWFKSGGYSGGSVTRRRTQLHRDIHFVH
jgi:hypothetical protein